jgi:hypothetical protein
VAPREVFVTADLDGGPSLVAAHPYHPGAMSVAQAHLMPTQTASGQLVRNTPNEAVLWSYTIQVGRAGEGRAGRWRRRRTGGLGTGKGLVGEPRGGPDRQPWQKEAGPRYSGQANGLPQACNCTQLSGLLPPPASAHLQLSAALRAVHAAGLAARPACLSPSKVLVLPLGRIRVGSLGLAEALAGDVVLSGDELLQAQRDDVTVGQGGVQGRKVRRADGHQAQRIEGGDQWGKGRSRRVLPATAGRSLLMRR